MRPAAAVAELLSLRNIKIAIDILVKAGIYFWPFVIFNGSDAALRVSCGISRQLKVTRSGEGRRGTRVNLSEFQVDLK